MLCTARRKPGKQQTKGEMGTVSYMKHKNQCPLQRRIGTRRGVYGGCCYRLALTAHAPAENC